MTKRNFMKLASLFAVCLAFIVVILGAYTRITGAGLGCPDWPGCYNQLMVPETPQAIAQAEMLYPHSPVEPTKAWAEMIHRYAAGTLSFTILILAIMASFRLKEQGFPKQVPFILLGLVIFQAALGMWTVTLKLAPIVVMGHLLGGLATLSLLWWLYLRLNSLNPTKSIFTHQTKALTKLNFIPWISFGIALVFLQIALGGWTSANYAALVCPDFPYCAVGQFFPHTDFQAAFTSMHAFFNLGQLSQAALISIQMTHRVGALLVGTYWLILSLFLIYRGSASQKAMGIFILGLIFFQITLGILNVKWMLPLALAVAHNAIAAVLLLSTIALLHSTLRTQRAK